MYFIFDSHSRSPQGLLSQSGLSTRILCSNVNELFVLIKRLASSMGFTNLVECNLTGARCFSNTIDPIRKNPTILQRRSYPWPKSAQYCWKWWWDFSASHRSRQIKLLSNVRKYKTEIMQNIRTPFFWNKNWRKHWKNT